LPFPAVKLTSQEQEVEAVFSADACYEFGQSVRNASPSKCFG
jgi:hypothetical protein